MKSKLSRTNASALLLLLVPMAGHAAESYDNCTGFIESLPAVISTQGTWCLNKDLTTDITTGEAITIATNNVTIDCNDFKVGGLAAGPGTLATGIYALDRLNATVRHCNVRGFRVGLHLSGINGGGHAVEDNRFDGNVYQGLRVEGDGSVVQRNRVRDTGGSTINANAIAVATYYSVDVLDNNVVGVAATAGQSGAVYGFLVLDNPDGRIIGNSVRGLVPDSPTASGITLEGSATDRNTVRDNDVVGIGSFSGYGIYCTSTSSSAKDNVVNGFDNAVKNCADGGGNHIVPSAVP